jgi:tetratricopeptide (TPR) repeat protein
MTTLLSRSGASLDAPAPKAGLRSTRVRPEKAVKAGKKTRLYVSVFVAAIAWQGVSAQSVWSQLAPARSNLQAVPLPRLDDLEPAVSGQIREQQQAFETASKSGGVSSGKLADEYGALGRLFHAYEFFESAEASYLNAARLAPRDVTWVHLLGYLYQQTGRLEDAANRFEQAVGLQPDDRAATIRLAQVYLGLNRLRDARAQFEGVVMVFPALARNGLGEIALRERRYDEAVGHFRAVLERVPEATSIHYSLAMAYRGLGRLDEARSHLKQRGAGGINVGDPIVDGLQSLVRGERGLVARGRRAYEAGHYQEAAAAFAKAVESTPGSVTARVNLGLTHLQLGNTTEAVANLQAAFELAPGDPDAARELLRVLLRFRRVDDAIGVLRKSRSLNPDDEETVVSLAILLAEQNRFTDAAALLDEENRKFPGRTTTATTLARLLASSPDRAIRNGPRALALAEGVYAAEPTPVHGETVALALAELGRCDEALMWMTRAVAEAEKGTNAAEATRLKGEMPKYESASCRQ